MMEVATATAATTSVTVMITIITDAFVLELFVQDKPNNSTGDISYQCGLVSTIQASDAAFFERRG